MARPSSAVTARIHSRARLSSFSRSSGVSACSANLRQSWENSSFADTDDAARLLVVLDLLGCSDQREVSFFFFPSAMTSHPTRRFPSCPCTPSPGAGCRASRSTPRPARSGLRFPPDASRTAAAAKEPDKFMGVNFGNDQTWRTVMTINLVSIVTAALLVSGGVASAQTRSSDPTSSPPELQSSTPNKPAIATVPETATDAPGVLSPQTRGQALNVSKRMGAEMDSAGDPKASPDGE